MIKGSKWGRPFTSNIFARAVVLKASAPRPYTVSVGKATRQPETRESAAKRISSSEMESICAPRKGEGRREKGTLYGLKDFSNFFLD
jgi:hypothetical protein